MRQFSIKSRHGYDIPCHETYNGEDRILIVCHGFGSSKASPMVRALERTMPEEIRCGTIYTFGKDGLKEAGKDA